jgi:ParB family chromosome partitioning protein
MDCNTETIQLTDIDDNDRLFNITTRTDVDDLITTINAIGIVRAPVVLKVEGRFVTISGFRRIDAWRKLNRRTLSVLVMKEGTSSLEAAQIAVADNAFERELNIIEQANACRLLSDFSPNQTAFNQACRSSGLPVNDDLIGKLQQVANFPNFLKQAILAETVSLPTALILAALPTAIGAVLSSLFNDLKIGINKQKELLTHITEIAAREDIAIDRLVNEKPIQDILYSGDADRAARAARIRLYLKRRRYPEMSKVEDDFASHLNMLALPASMTLLPPKHFEGSQYTVSIRFANKQELRECHERLGDIIDHPALNQLLP